MLKRPLSRPNHRIKTALMRPLFGFRSNTQEMEIRIGGMMLGTIAVNSKSFLKGALVRIVIQASARAKTTDRPDAPRPKINEVNIKR